MTTSRELREARHHAGLTQAELARRMNVSLRTVTNWENADGDIPERAEAKVQAVLGATLAFKRQTNPGSASQRIPAEVRQRLKAAQEEAYEYLRIGEYPENFEATRAERGLGGYERKERILRMFSDVDLSHELSRRARERGTGPTDWSVRAIENDHSRIQALGDIADDLALLIDSQLPGSNVRARGDDELRQRDHRLAASEASEDRGEDTDY